MNKLPEALLLLLLPLASAATNVDGARDPYFPCLSCHGQNGEGSSAINAPSLYGQTADYISRQLVDYREGRRGQHPEDPWGAQMALMAANLSDEAIATLGERISLFPSPRPDPASTAVQPPAEYMACAACHGVQGQGNSNLESPRIGGMDSAYIVRQLRNFRDGKRGAGNASGPAAVMRAAIPADYSDDSIEKLAHYLETL